MPAATSNPSVSPARRADPHRSAIPFAHPGQNPFTNPRPLQSPQTYGNGYSHFGMYATPSADSRPHRNSIGYPPGILPTPDPSNMSEEDKDVALQLMRLGDMTNVSHGRTSASTLDDTFSGKADAASSTGATSDGDGDSGDELPPPRRQKLEMPTTNDRLYQTTESHFIAPREHAEASGDDADYEDGGEDSLMFDGVTVKSQKPRLPSLKTGSLKPKSKIAKPLTTKVKKSNSISTSGPMSPASQHTQLRKPSVAGSGIMPSQSGDDDNPDLSTKPRCQRCRKSKKGCDRQRPCGRCRDAGLTADQCVSEDEGNGRKGRYGRHMGVPVLHGEAPIQPVLLPAAPISAPMAPPMSDANKKRKR